MSILAYKEAAFLFVELIRTLHATDYSLFVITLSTRARLEFQNIIKKDSVGMFATDLIGSGTDGALCGQKYCAVEA